MANKKFKRGTVKNQKVLWQGKNFPIANGEFADGEVKFNVVTKYVGVKANGTYKNKLYAEIL